MERTRTPATQEKVYTLRGAAGQPQKRFTGTHLAFVSTGEHRRKSYWMTLDLYRKQDNTYVLHRIGYSVVYHAMDGCTGGEEVTLRKLLDVTEYDADPCLKCRPMPLSAVKHAVEGKLDTDQTVLLDRVYYTVIEIPDVPTLIHALEFVPRDSTTGTRVISRPGQQLLDLAAEHDAAIAAIGDMIEDI